MLVRFDVNRLHHLMQYQYCESTLIKCVLYWSSLTYWIFTGIWFTYFYSKFFYCAQILTVSFCSLMCIQLIEKLLKIWPSVFLHTPHGISDFRIIRPRCLLSFLCYITIPSIPISNNIIKYKDIVKKHIGSFRDYNQLKIWTVISKPALRYIFLKNIASYKKISMLYFPSNARFPYYPLIYLLFMNMSFWQKRSILVKLWLSIIMCY